MNEPVNKKVIVFDLDGTLAESKQALDGEMADLLAQLVDHGYYIAVMSGGAFNQYQQQFLSLLHFSEDQYQKLLLLPTSGAALYVYQNSTWQQVYQEVLSTEDRERIITTLQAIIKKLALLPPQSYGELIEDRSTQITYSGLGQQAPNTAKEVWDPHKKKRAHIAALFSEQLPMFDVHIGGMTSIDITRKGIDKAYGVKKVSDFLNTPISAMVYIGDALFPGGNDATVQVLGIECIAVKNIAETKKYIKTLL